MKKNSIGILLCTLIVLFAGFNNKYPLFSEKTSDYIEAGFSRTASTIECLIYGIFVKQTSWGFSLWLTSLTQSFLFVLMLFFLLRSLVNKESRLLPLFIISAFISTFIFSASFMVSSIDPGVFGCMAIMGVWVLLFSRTLSKRDAWIVGVILFMGIIMNKSYQQILTGVGCIFLLWFVGQTINLLHFSIRLKGRRVAICLIAIGIGVLPQLFLNKTFPKKTNYTTNESTLAIPSVTTFVGIQKSLQAFDRYEVVQAINNHFGNETREFFLTNQWNKWVGCKWHDRFSLFTLLLCILLTIYQLIKRFNPMQCLFFIYVLVVNLIYLLRAIFMDGFQSYRQFELVWLFLLPPLLGLSIKLSKIKLNS